MAVREKQVKIPEKKTMNLYQVDNRENSVPMFIVGLILIGVFVILFCQFAVINRLREVNNLESELNALQSTVYTMQNELQDYDEVEEKYYRYTDSYMEEDTSVLHDRIDVLDILERTTMNLGTVNRITVSGNSVGFTVRTDNLDDLAKIEKNLNNNSSVSDVSVYTASSSNNTSYVESTVTFRVLEEDR